MFKPAPKEKVVVSKLPRHVAIIMDGNGRWAKSRGLPRTAGHKKGAESTREIVTACREEGIEYLTIYAFSSENWQRSKDEVNDLMNLLSLYIRKELKALVENNVKLTVIGELDRLPENVRKEVLDAQTKTLNNTALNLQIALSYGSRQELCDAAKKMAHDTKNGIILPDDIDAALFESYLYTKNIPDPDLLIRTSGEHRISNFLLWQLAYTELYFTPCLWPDFNRAEFMQALENYSTRDRRYGTA